MVKRFARQNRTTRSSRRSWTGRAFAALLACALGAALAVGPVGCAGGEPDGADVPTATATSSFTAMDTGMTLTVHVVSQAVADDAANACRQRVLELDELLAPENATSEIVDQRRKRRVDGCLAGDGRARRRVADAAHRTGGAFDPTVYSADERLGLHDRRPSGALLDEGRAAAAWLRCRAGGRRSGWHRHAGRRRADRRGRRGEGLRSRRAARPGCASAT